MRSKTLTSPRGKYGTLRQNTAVNRSGRISAASQTCVAPHMVHDWCWRLTLTGSAQDQASAARRITCQGMLDPMQAHDLNNVGTC
jgi:hypothetical protein